MTTKNANGSTALHCASQCGNLDIVKLYVSFRKSFPISYLSASTFYCYIEIYVNDLLSSYVDMENISITF